MPKSCCVVGCKSNKQRNPDLRFPILPSRERDPERRQLWLQAIRRQDKQGKLWDPVSSHVYVCGRHFITGFHVNDPLHPDYVPSILPHAPEARSPSRKLDRFKNARKRELDALLTSSLISKRRLTKTSSEVVATCSTNEDATAPSEPSTSLGLLCPLGESEKAQIYAEMENLRRERDEALKEKDAASANWSRERLSAKSVEGNDEACKAMTGLSWNIFLGLHSYLVQFVNSGKKCKLTTEDQLFITLVKLRQNPTFTLLCHILDIGHTTLRDLFQRWINLMSSKITHLIHWPERQSMSSTIPPDMKAKFPHLTSIIDCFEIRIEHSKKLKARAKSYSNYKNWTTVKYFIACHPAGSITFLSKGWGGRASDVKIVRESGFISPSYHHPGDQILADRGFTLKDNFSLLGASLLTPAFTRGRKQLPGREVEESRVLSNIRIHIERVIGVLKGRFHILDGPLPLSLVKCRADELENREMATIDKIVHVCAALVNMSGSVVYNKNRVGDE